MHVTTGCATRVPYRDEVVRQVLLQMSDQNIRARTLTQTASGILTKLSEVIEGVLED